MTINSTKLNSQPKPASELTQIFLVLGGVVVFAFVAPVFGMFAFRWALSSVLAFVGAGVLLYGVSVWLIFRFARPTLLRGTLAVAALIPLALYLRAPLTYGDYALPVQPAAGHQLVWVTQPTNRYASGFQAMQYAFETGCEYRLNGWAADGSLVYTSACLPGVWRYQPGQPNATWALFAAVETNTVARWDGIQFPAMPEGLRDATPFSVKILERATSPNGQWEAVVIQPFYAPGDVVLVSRGR